MMQRAIFYLVFFSSLILFQSCGGGDDGMGMSEGVLSISDMTVAEGNQDGTITFTVTLSGGMDGAVTSVSFRTEDGTATAGEDYRAVSGEMIAFTQANSTQQVQIEIIGDEDVEQNETFSVVLFSPSNATLGKDTGTGTIQNDDFDGEDPYGIPETGYFSATEYPGLELAWSDEFNGTSINMEDWSIELGTGINGWFKNQKHYVKQENTFTHNGHLIIEAKEEEFLGSDYTSSRLITENIQEWQYGRIDVRAAMPKGQGMWPALSMLGADLELVGYPNCGEINIMEMFGSDGLGDRTVHGSCNWFNGVDDTGFSSDFIVPGAKLADEFHVYSIVWSVTEIRWLIDDVPYNSINITPPDMGAFHQPFFFVFNLAVGGDLAGDPDDNTEFPQRMFVDYIRVFQ